MTIHSTSGYAGKSKYNHLVSDCCYVDDTSGFFAKALPSNVARGTSLRGGRDTFAYARAAAEPRSSRKPAIPGQSFGLERKAGIEPNANYTCHVS